VRENCDAADHAVPHVDRGELGVVGGDGEVAGEDEIEAGAVGVALDAGDDRLRVGAQGVAEAEVVDAPQVAGNRAPLRRPAGLRPACRRGRGDALLDVVAGAKGAAGAGEDDGPHVVVLGARLEGLEQAVAQLAVDGVEHARPVERQPADADGHLRHRAEPLNRQRAPNAPNRRRTHISPYPYPSNPRIPPGVSAFSPEP